MGPARKSRAQSRSTVGPSTTQRLRPEKEAGVQKLKSSLRQTRRLLAKDNLAADVRVETERRLKALEADLVQAEASKKERALAVRYHKVKFFERQKVMRKLAQIQKRLSAADSSSKTQLESTLSELRVDLNYILHYPKTKKYISLFPPEIRHSERNVDPTPSEEEITKTNLDREEIRSWIRARMEKGELSSEPELHLDAKGTSERGLSSHEEAWAGGTAHRPPGTSTRNINNIGNTDDIEKDAFFGDDDDDET